MLESLGAATKNSCNTNNLCEFTYITAIQTMRC